MQGKERTGGREEEKRIKYQGKKGGGVKEGKKI